VRSASALAAPRWVVLLLVAGWRAQSVAYDGRVTPASPDDRAFGPPDADDWVALVDGPLPVDAATAWAVRTDCGAVVSFSGTARDHAGDRRGVTGLEYEAYEEQARPRMAAIAAAAHVRWPELGRLALIHRLGPVPIGESAVVVVASAPHRAEAFEAARFAIDAVKATVPIWKRESWDGGESWGIDAQHVVELDEWLHSSSAGRS
jgi:molybdopterin synthase catalytic subunit